MDPLSISASVLTIIAATITTIKTLNETVGRYKGRDKTLARLQDGLDGLISILVSLEEAADNETPILALLKDPISRCAQVSREFEDAMKKFGAKSKSGLKDWTKMEFMRGDINEFIDTLADYKSTITIVLGILNMHASRLTQPVLGEYKEIVKDTAYNLEIRLQQIDKKITPLASYHSTLLEDSSIDLQDEKAVTMQCLRICERATSYIQSLQNEKPILQREALGQSARDLAHRFEAQLLTQKTLTETRNKLVETIGRLQERLDSATFNKSSDRESETLRLKEEIDLSKQCLEVCKEATNKVSSPKIHVIEEVIADNDCDLMVVTTLADLFHAGGAKSKGRSMQLVGSMSDDAVREISKERYGNRFGALAGHLQATTLPSILHKDVNDDGKPKLSRTTDNRGELVQQELFNQQERPNKGHSIPEFRYKEWSGNMESNDPKFPPISLRGTNEKTMFSTDSGYSSIASNADQENPDEIQRMRDPTNWESRSVASVRSLATMDTDSSINPTAAGGAAEELAEMLVKDELIRGLIEDGYRNIDFDRFERNLRRILKKFAASLRSEARNDLEKSAVHLVHNYRAFVILHIKKYLELPDDKHATFSHELRKRKQTQFALERYLEGLSGAKDFNTEDQPEQNEFGSDIDSDLSNEEQPYLPTLEKVKLYLVSSVAYSEFKQQLADFVMPYCMAYHLPGNIPDLVDMDLTSNEVADAGGDVATKDRKAIVPEPNDNPDVSFSKFRSSSIEDAGVIWNTVLDTTQQNEKERLQNIGTGPPSLEGLKSEAGKLEEVLQSCKLWMTCSLAYLSLTLQNRWAKWRRKPVAKGRSRIEWTCACGHDLFADFNDKSIDMLNKYALTLQRPPNGASHSTTSQSSTNHLASPPSTHLQPNPSGILMQPLQALDGLLPVSASQTLSVAATNARDLSFLELCVNTGPHLKSLAEIDTGNISTDGALFEAIRKRYLDLRDFRSRFWLLKPAAISFVRFSLENRHRIGILQKPLALPPKSEVDAKNWIYDPCPLEGDPPIAEDLFLHYLQCKGGSSTLFWMLRFPLKLETSLLNSAAFATFGWGIHIEEGPDFAALFKANFLVLVLSGVAAGLWKFFEHDFQGAFGFSSWIVAVLNSLLMAFMFKWKQE